MGNLVRYLEGNYIGARNTILLWNFHGTDNVHRNWGEPS